MEQPGRSHRKRLFLIIGSIVLVTGVLLLGPMLWALAQRLGAAVMIGNQLEELEAARANWAARPFTRYRLVIEDESKVGSFRQEVEIENEAVTTVFENTYGPLRTSTDLLNDIESTITSRECGPNGCVCDGVISVQAVYHAQLGYPRSIRKYLKGDWTTAPWPLELERHGCTLVGIVFPEITVTLTPLE